ncbi:MAG: hypothetical protein NWF07_13710 [Candidatus Bathyarchaeota archaeon]|nr:hypothetical protein [Candidatus Bathyarchaeota archaeon]
MEDNLEVIEITHVDDFNEYAMPAYDGIKFSGEFLDRRRPDLDSPLLIGRFDKRLAFEVVERNKENVRCAHAFMWGSYDDKQEFYSIGNGYNTNIQVPPFVLRKAILELELTGGALLFIVCDEGRFI